MMLVGSQDARLPLDDASMDALEASPSIVFAGHQGDTVPFFAAADIVLLPSYREGLPTVLLEAAAMQKASIATRIPGCVDVVQDGVTGDLVPVRNSRALADALIALIADPKRRESYGKAARNFVVENFDSRLIHEAVLVEYRRLASR